MVSSVVPDSGDGRGMRVRQGKERRTAGRCLDVWHSLADTRSYPTRSEVQPALFGNLWRFVFVVDVSEGIGAARFDHSGAVLQEICLRPLAGAALSVGLPDFTSRNSAVFVSGRCSGETAAHHQQ